MRKTILTATTLVSLAGLVACGPKEESQPDRQPTISITVASREDQPQPVETRFGDCGDEAPPCMTYDDGTEGDGIYIVMPGKQPVRLTVCDAEDYPTNMPCVFKHQDPQDRWILLTPAI